MTPAARVQAAIEVIDAIVEGQAAEQALTRWARTSRFAGSKDRAAVRDHVFDVLRCWRSSAALGGGDSGRARMLGLLRSQGIDPLEMFTGQGHGPQPLTQDERAAGRTPSAAEARDVPDWVWPHFCAQIGEDQAQADVMALRRRAPVDLRVNIQKTTRMEAQNRLSQDGVDTLPHSLCETALRVTAGARQVSQSGAFRDGWVELQDVASQAVVAALALRPGQRALDYCAGGGGKALAIAAQTGGLVWAHDADANRMRDLPKRATRAGADICVTKKPTGVFDLVLCDVPCSGSGSWRRAPDGKWRLTPDALARLGHVQSQIMDECVPLVAPLGHLAYATCSLFDQENKAQVDAFLMRHPEFELEYARGFRLTDGGDGFFVAVLTRR